MRTKKIYYVCCTGYATKCVGYEDANYLFRHKKMYNDYVKVIDTDGHLITEWRKKVKNYSY